MDQTPMLTLTICPACQAPAEILRRYVFESADGPIEHALVQCIHRHWFVAPIAALASDPAEPERKPAPSRR